MQSPERHGPPSPTRTNGSVVTKSDFARWSSSEQKRRGATEEQRQRELRAEEKEQRAQWWAQRGADLHAKAAGRQEAIRAQKQADLRAKQEAARQARDHSAQLEQRRLETTEAFTGRAATRAQERHRTQLEAGRRRQEGLRAAASQARKESEGMDKYLDELAHERHAAYEADKRQLTERVRAETSPETLRKAQRGVLQQRQALANKTRQDQHEWRVMRETNAESFMEGNAQTLRQDALASHANAKKAKNECAQNKLATARGTREERQQTRAESEAVRQHVLAEKQAQHDSVLTAKFEADDRAAPIAAATLSPDNHRSFRFRSRRGQRPQEVRL